MQCARGLGLPVSCVFMRLLSFVPQLVPSSFFSFFFFQERRQYLSNMSHLNKMSAERGHLGWPFPPARAHAPSPLLRKVPACCAFSACALEKRNLKCPTKMVYGVFCALKLHSQFKDTLAIACTTVRNASL